MSERQDMLDEQVGKLLTRCYGDVKADAEFRAKLLSDLKMKAAEIRAAESAATGERSDDANWSRLLTRAHVSCEPRAQFRNALLSELKIRQAGLATAGGKDGFHALLSTAQQDAVAPRREFKTRLLDNLKERQRVAADMRKRSRNRTIFVSALSSMAAAAAVVFVVWLQPFAVPGNAYPPSASPALAATDMVQPAPDRTRHAVAALSENNFVQTAAAGTIPASYTNYRVADVFKSVPLPATMRGINMEINLGDGWKEMDETVLASVSPGVALRPRADAKTAGLGFGDGSTIHMRSDSVIEATTSGFTVRQGTMTVNVPNNSDSRFYLHFPERDLALEPGTMLAVTVEPEDMYARGGAPAPVIKVLDGGMAVARGKAGSGILLANQVYSLNSYVTPDIPGRPLCAAECAELERALLMEPVVPENGYAPTQMVAGADSVLTFRSSPLGYAKNGNKWVASDYDGETPTIRIQYLSDDYFGFASARRDLANALALGSDVVIDGGDGVFYEVYR